MKKCIFYRNKSLTYFVMFYILLLKLLVIIDLTLNNSMYFSPVFLCVLIILFIIILLKTTYKYEFDNEKIINGFIIKRIVYWKDIHQIQSIKNGLVLFSGSKKVVVKLLAYDINRDNYEILINTINENIPSGIEIDKDSQKLLDIGVERIINSWDGSPNLSKRIAVYSIGVGAILVIGMITIIIESSYLPQTSKLLLILQIISTIILALFFMYAIYLVIKLQNIYARLIELERFKFIIPILIFIFSKWFLYDSRNNPNITCILAYILILILGLLIIFSILIMMYRLKYKRITKEIFIEPKKITSQREQKCEKNTRELNDREKYWIHVLLANQSAGREILINQMSNSVVTSNYSYESITIKFTVNPDVNRFPYIRTAPFDVLAHQHDGTIIVMLLYVVNGYISELQIFNTELTKISADFTLDMIETRQTTKVLH